MEGKHANNKLRSEYQAGCQAFQFRTLSMNWTRIRASGPIHCCMFTRRSSKSIFLRPMISVSVKFDTNALNEILNNSNSTWMHEIHNACISLRIHEINTRCEFMRSMHSSFMITGGACHCRTLQYHWASDWATSAPSDRMSTCLIAVARIPKIWSNSEMRQGLGVVSVGQ
jgi:hypothetical protein